MQKMLRAFGQRLAVLRKDQGMTQPDLAFATGLSLNTISNVERGLHDPSVLTASLIQVHLGSPGLELSDDGFLPVASTLPPGKLPFPNLVEPLPVMILNIGAVIQKRRQSMGLTQESLSRISGVHLNTLWNLERGLVVPSISTMFRLLRSLNVRQVRGTLDGIVLI
ncbi:MAG: transcriptional regulator [Firmicutes bacterium]|nr:transcriptional regulator [Bacillota bacterium]